MVYILYYYIIILNMRVITSFHFKKFLLWFVVSDYILWYWWAKVIAINYICENFILYNMQLIFSGIWLHYLIYSIRKCCIVVLYTHVINGRWALQHVVYEAAGISYRFSVIMCLAVKLSLGSPTDSLPGCRYLFFAAYKVYFC